MQRVPVTSNAIDPLWHSLHVCFGGAASESTLAERMSMWQRVQVSLRCGAWTNRARTDHVAPVRASVRDAIETVLALLPDRGAVRFRDLVAGVDERLEMIVRFLAVLELFKQGIVDLDQAGNFAELIVRPLDPDERVALDLASIEDWEDEPRDVMRTAAAEPVGERA